MALVRCPDCGKMLSEKAPACIQCGRPMGPDTDRGDLPNIPSQTRVNDIFDNAHHNTVQPEKQLPFKESESTTQQSSTDISAEYVGKPKPNDGWFSCRALIAAVVLASILNILLSALFDTQPAKNIGWTVAWIYLSIVAWRYWKWKALLPYPAQVIISAVLGVVLLSSGEDKISLIRPTKRSNQYWRIGSFLCVSSQIKKRSHTEPGSYFIGGGQMIKYRTSR